jgi:hypothetical protein
MTLTGWLIKPRPPQLGDAGMVLSLESLAGAEDAALLTGHALVLLGRDPEAAQAAFLRSCRPLAALEMRRDLKQWPAALALARRLAPEEVPAIGRAHAAALELVGDHAAARANYQEVLAGALGKGRGLVVWTTGGRARLQPARRGPQAQGGQPLVADLTADREEWRPLISAGVLQTGSAAAPQTQALDAPPGGASAADQSEHRRTCLGGLARTMLKLGDVQAGKAAALEVRLICVRGLRKKITAARGAVRPAVLASVDTAPCTVPQSNTLFSDKAKNCVVAKLSLIFGETKRS